MIDITSLKEPTVIEGNIAFDDRGSVKFVNSFDPGWFKRFYIVENHRQGFIRAWHGHKIETKGVLVLKGAALVGAVPIDINATPKVFTLSASKPCVLIIPSGYCNGFKSLTEDCQIMFFSTTTIEEAKGDDYRFPYDQWNCWEEDYR